MGLTLAVVQALAPDQGVLDSAAKLLQPRHWLRVAHEPSQAVAWGECQGSGANPYLVVVDVAEHGYKCTCPSRKFPCKHAVALMWQFAETPQRFEPAEPPPWVIEWLGRRKRGTAAVAADPAGKSLARARDADTADAQPTAEDLARREQQAARRKADVDAGVHRVLADLDVWIRDQLRAGIVAFVDDAAARCRRIAARLVDAKCAGLASRADELPAHLLALPRELRSEAALHAFGQWVLLARAWAATPDDADARAALLQPQTREAVLAHPDALRVRTHWEVVGVRTETRRDGLVSQATWLLDAAAAGIRFALLQDYFPASAGRRGAAFTPGQRVAAECVYYPGSHPLRAILADGAAELPEHTGPRPAASDDPLAGHRAHLTAVPWAPLTPLLLGAGALHRDARGQLWWRGAAGAVLRVAPMQDDALWCAVPLHAAVALYDGFQATVLELDTPHGRAYPDA